MQLNPQQQTAVEHLHSPLLVLAGAGSGKTRVITEKIAWMIRNNRIPSGRIAAITFTNKSAKEMQARLRQTLKRLEAPPLISTFHSLGLRILQTHGKALGYKAGFSIFDSTDSLSLVRDLLPKDCPKETVSEARWRISLWKNQGLNPSNAMNQIQGQAYTQSLEIYAAYQEKLKHFNAVDFDDLILQPVHLFETSTQALDAWRSKIQYLLVDEYQDTNASQYRLMRNLLGEKGRLTAVGDDDQSIYGWRGAQPENLAQLQLDFSELEVIKLEQNYRSCSNILKAANHLIAHNPHLFEKKLWSTLGQGEPIEVIVAEDGDAEARRISSLIMHQNFRSDTPYRDFCILYRSNQQARVFEQALRQHQIPYHLSGGLSFFERAEVKDVISYLRLLANPSDTSALLRVINTPKREIGAASVEKLALFADRQGLSLYESAKQPLLLSQLSKKSARALSYFIELIETYRAKVLSMPADKLLQALLETVHYEAWLYSQSEQKSVAERRWANVQDIIQWLQQSQKLAPSGTGLAELISQMALLNNPDEEEEPGNAVRLMTLHASKGLEFPFVYMVGVEEGRLPHSQALEEGSEAEERRLMYVGITRAQTALVLSYARKRKRFGKDETCKPSRFLKEIPHDLLHWEGQNPERDQAKSKARSQVHIANIKAMLEDWDD